MSDMWNRVAGAWERNADFVDEHLEAATGALLDAAGVAEGQAVLDLAAGPGGAGLAAARRVGAGGRVVLADVAEEMVAAAARRANGRSEVDTLVCDQAAIAAEDASFDAVIVRHGLMFMPEPDASVAEAARVLRPGGRYAAMTWGPREANPWLGLILDAVGAQFGVTFPPPGVSGPFSLSDPDQLAGALRGGGLEDVEVEAIDTPMHAASIDDWWARVPGLAGPLAMALAGMEDEVREEIRVRAIAAGSAVAAPVGDGIAMPGCVLVASGLRR
jgi:SAM-dependent methyltransferase